MKSKTLLSGALVASNQGRLAPPGAVAGEYATIISVYSGNHYVPPPDVMALLQRRQGTPAAYRAQVPPLLSSFVNDKARYQHVLDAWGMVYRRKVGRKSYSKLRLKYPTVAHAMRLPQMKRIPPLLWYWWGWDREEFHSRRRGVVAPLPTLSMFWMPGRIEHMAPYFHQFRDDSWRKSPPRIKSVEEINRLRSSLRWSIRQSRPLTVADAQKTLDAICTEERYAHLLAIANQDVLGLMRSEAEDLANGRWVWA